MTVIQNVAYYTIPKSGSYLIKKIFSVYDINAGDPSSWVNLDSESLDVSFNHIKIMDNPFHPEDVISNGVYAEYESSKFYEEMTGRVVLLVRDPRDQLLSYINWVIKQNFDDSDLQDWMGISYENKIKSFIKASRLDFKTNANFREIDIRAQVMCHFQMFKEAVNLYKNLPKNVILVKFEDLIGPNAGGSSEKVQIKTIKKICNHLGFNRTDKEIAEGLPRIWGGSITFSNRPKKVGYWKTAFNEEATKLFEEKYGQIMHILGYKT